MVNIRRQADLISLIRFSSHHLIHTSSVVTHTSHASHHSPPPHDICPPMARRDDVLVWIRPSDVYFTHSAPPASHPGTVGISSPSSQNGSRPPHGSVCSLICPGRGRRRARSGPASPVGGSWWIRCRSCGMASCRCGLGASLARPRRRAMNPVHPFPELPCSHLFSLFLISFPSERNRPRGFYSVCSIYECWRVSLHP